jgi:hypothetical protein
METFWRQGLRAFVDPKKRSFQQYIQRFGCSVVMSYKERDLFIALIDHCFL